MTTNFDQNESQQFSLKISSGGETYSSKSLAGHTSERPRNLRVSLSDNGVLIVSFVLPYIKGNTRLPLHCLPDTVFPVNSLSTILRRKPPIVNYVRVYGVLCVAKKSENVHYVCVFWSSVSVDTAWQLHGRTG